ncbi:hypothetical protein [Lactobacillus sp.]|uniref:hypothetical protein n=1 Tax=Lactobacillus sp. TaxID=1591 RepID=UPI0019B909E2|nr:hypothetical protein [Lactobacillus sp.]MBD5430498.1 hypothetical protein [Lactobacillus sp.]
MKLFGKRRKNGEKKPKDKIKKKKRKKLYKTPSDVKLFYQMPVILVVSVILLLTGFIWIEHNHRVYTQQVMASSMKYNEGLPLWGGKSKGALTLGHTRLSKDGKTLAVEIKYDDTAHQQLSSFGNRYKLRLVDTKQNPMPNVKLRYGIFGTDGSGVLTVYSPTGFRNQAFIVMIIDNGQLVSTDDLQDDTTQMTDDDLDDSITAELSSGADDNPDSTNDNGEDSTRAKLPPLYYVRLNAHNAKRNYRNWKNDSDIVTDLFIKKNLADLRRKMDVAKQKIEKAQKTLHEMNIRLEENKDDAVARDNKQNLQTTLSDLQRNYKLMNKRYQKLEDSSISSDILEPEQTKHHTYTIDSLENMY